VTSPFLDAAATRELYAGTARLAARTGALARAKTRGRPAADVIAAHVAREVRCADPVIVDVGCGRGTSTIALAAASAPSLVLGVDASGALLAEARARFAGAGNLAPSAWLQSDFHHLPLADASADAVVAAFCLYHSTTPVAVITELARVLRPGGLAVLATKSATSYAELDDLVQLAGLDERATQRPSLYSSAHSRNLPGLAASSLSVVSVENERHEFAFTGLQHVAEYLATSPKYHLPAVLVGQPQALAAALGERMPDRPVTTSSTVTFVIARRAGGRT